MFFALLYAHRVKHIAIRMCQMQCRCHTHLAYIFRIHWQARSDPLDFQAVNARRLWFFTFYMCPDMCLMRVRSIVNFRYFLRDTTSGSQECTCLSKTRRSLRRTLHNGFGLRLFGFLLQPIPTSSYCSLLSVIVNTAHCYCLYLICVSSLGFCNSGYGTADDVV